MKPQREGTLCGAQKVAACALAILVSIQVVPVRTLARPEAAFTEGLTSIAAGSELRDGPVAVIDYIEGRVLLFDASLGSFTQVGRRGQGPGEYTIPAALLPLSGDSLLILDRANTRMLLVTPDGKPGRFMSSRLGTGCSQVQRGAGITVTDTLGHFYRETSPIRVRSDGRSELADSAAIERWQPPCHVDTVAFVPDPFGGNATIMGGFVVGRPGTERPPCELTTQWAVARDGRVALVRPDPYRVDFIEPTGTRRDGLPIQYDRIPVDDAIKAQWRTERRQPHAVVTVYRNGGGFVSMMTMPYQEPSSWPRYLPPFLRDAVRFAPDGHLWIQRTVRPTEPPTYDVIDETARLVLKVRLQPRSRVIGFGKGSVYVVRRDDEDLEYLERYRLPMP